MEYFVDRVTDEGEARWQEGHPPTWPVPVAYAAGLLTEAVALAAGRGFPYPANYMGEAIALAGLSADPPPDLILHPAAFTDPARLPATGALWRHQAFATRMFLEGVPALDAAWPTIEGLVEALPAPVEPRPEVFDPAIAMCLDATFCWPLDALGLAALDGILATCIPAVFTDDDRHRWQQLLRHDAYLFAQGNLPELAALAGTAAWAIGPTSGVPVADQPFVRDLLRLAVLWEYLD